eukprot:5926292-Pyramimonas_sp.AAC.1
MFFAGRVILTMGSIEGVGPRVEAGNIVIGGQSFHVYIEPNVNFKDARGTLSVPAWSVPPCEDPGATPPQSSMDVEKFEQVITGVPGTIGETKITRSALVIRPSVIEKAFSEDTDLILLNRQ